MVKLGKAFSILVVFTLLILLAPAVVLTGGNVGAQPEAVTEEITATFTFTEGSDGDWLPLTVGSGGIQLPGPLLMQYTRPYVDANNVTVPDCGFRNYTIGAGSSASTEGDLNGTISLAWITFRFDGQYPGDLYYSGATDFGWMAGRAHFIDGANNFTFVFIADLDCDNTMTNAEGKGFMVSVNETGDFAGHKVIGEFEVVKTGTAYNWTVDLRNYPPNEVYYRGLVTVHGGVLQEYKDGISDNLAIVDFDADGPVITPTGVQPTQYEEIAWGRDPLKNVTGGPMGVGAVMDIARSGAQYLLTPGGQVNIQAAEACLLHINDTYAQTGDDGSTYGNLYYYLLITIPYQELPIGDYFNQTGYTFYPFGMFLEPSGWYTGSETFARAIIKIESKVGVAAQNSNDTSYGLYPHPKVESITPACGYPGQNLTVTINGKYFLRAAGEKSGWINNSGELDFGDNITVTSYTINDPNSPEDNSITANINILGGASTGVRNVTVTSCFNYTNTTGTPSGCAPYYSGQSNFSVCLANATLEGDVTFESRGSPPDSKWIEPFAVRCFEPGNLNNEIWSGTATTNDTGVFTYTNRPCCTYDIGIKNWTCLSTLATDVSLIGGAISAADFGTVKQGDANNDDLVSSSDYSLLSFAYGTYPAGGGNWDPNCDFTRDDYIGSGDYSLLSFYYNQWGDLYGY